MSRDIAVIGARTRYTREKYRDLAENEPTRRRRKTQETLKRARGVPPFFSSLLSSWLIQKAQWRRERTIGGLRNDRLVETRFPAADRCANERATHSRNLEQRFPINARIEGYCRPEQDTRFCSSSSFFLSSFLYTIFKFHVGRIRRISRACVLRACVWRAGANASVSNAHASDCVDFGNSFETFERRSGNFSVSGEMFIELAKTEFKLNSVNCINVS